MLEGLNALPWHEFGHAYGSAEEVPMWIRQLASTEKRVRQHALNELSGSICHQGFNCDMTVYVVPFLIELLQEPSVQGKEGILELLASIYRDEETPIVDAQEAAGVGSPIYLPFLEHPESSVRMWAVYLLSFFTKRREEVRAAFKQLLERELEPQEKANLLLACENILENTPEDKHLLLGCIQRREHDLVVFAAALILTTLAQNETPPEIVQWLAAIMLDAPDTLADFVDLPLGGGPKHAARNALSHLEPQRLESLAPAALKQWPNASTKVFDALKWAESLGLTYNSSEWVEFLLFLLFQGKATPERPRAHIPATQLTIPQRELLELFYKSSIGHWYKLSFYGLPDSAAGLAAYLHLEPLPVFPSSSAKQTMIQWPEDEWSTAVRKYYPELDIFGWGGRHGSETRITNPNLLFRFPKSSLSLENMKREVALLRFLNKRLPIPIPNPLYYHLSTLDMPFMGYVKLPGKPLFKEMRESIDEEERLQRVADQLGSFLSSLHGMIRDNRKRETDDQKQLFTLPLFTFMEKVSKAWYRGFTKAVTFPDLPVRYPYETYEALLVMAQRSLFPHLSPEQREHLQASFTAFFAHPRLQQLVLIHNNLIPENILYDAYTQHISGILDFRQAGLGDPASDIASLLIFYGEDFVRRCARVYPALETLLERARFYALANVLQKALFYKAQQDMEAFHSVMATYPL